MKYLNVYSKKDLLAKTQIRKFETKLGERLLVVKDPKNVEASIAKPEVKFVIAGAAEDIGIRGNYGISGAATAWDAFLNAFLNIQSNDFLEGSNMLLLGCLDFKDVADLIEQNALDPEEKIAAYRHAVTTIDDAVEELVKLITQNRKIPIIIGGGHNNAYPCIKGAAKGLHKAGLINLAQINAINLDAHADYRPIEGRHSGNAFRYADEDGYLEKYCIVGLHENYLPQNSWLDIVNDPFLDFITYEDIFIHEKRTFTEAIAHATAFTDDTYCGIEIDMDSIEHALSSAYSPVGITATCARQFINYAAHDSKVAYCHIAEGASALETGATNFGTGKLISYLVSDFVKALES